MLATPEDLDEAALARWLGDFYSWDLVDGACFNVFWKLPDAYEKAAAWSELPGEYARRAGFALMAALALKDKKAPDAAFLPFKTYLLAGAPDDRNFVKKAVNWALRQIGKRNLALHPLAVDWAEEMQKLDAPAAKWSARCALRELHSEKVLTKLEQKAAKA